LAEVAANRLERWECDLRPRRPAAPAQTTGGYWLRRGKKITETVTSATSHSGSGHGTERTERVETMRIAEAVREESMKHAPGGGCAGGRILVDSSIFRHVASPVWRTRQ
jgi:hypothetical protein